jgi:hypothetical protein
MHLFPAGDDLTLIVLKGHLLIEEQLNARLQDIARRPEHLPDRLGFHSLSMLCKALFYGENAAEEWFWSAISRLNAIRNHLAHSLEAPQLETKVDEMVRTLEQDVPFAFRPSGSKTDRTRQALAFLYGVVQGMRTRPVTTPGVQ